VLSPGVRVASGAVVRESVILTDSRIESGAVVEHAVLDKKVQVGQNARVGASLVEPRIAMVGKHGHIVPGMTVEPGAMIGPDVIESDYSSDVVRGSDFIQTKRLPYEI
jgi:glucose-1-phosphate adenylyltransferase